MNGAVTITRPVVDAPFSLSAARESFQQAAPYRHLVIDGFLDARLALQVAREFPAIDDPRWTRRTHYHSKKLTLASLPETAQLVVDHLHGPETLTWLESLTGVQDLTGDDDLFGGGLHCSPRGGFLDVHTDFTRHPVTGHRRALNLLIYLSEDWDPEWGGWLELWDAPVRECVRAIAPTFNRAVLFETHDRSFHGHPDPLTCPPDVARQSLALYYYRPAKPWDLVVPTTDYRARPHEYGKRLRKWLGRLVR